MKRTSGWGGLLRVESPCTSAPVPCDSGGSASPGPLYSYRTSLVQMLPSGAAAGMAGIKGGKRKIVRMHHNVPFARLYNQVSQCITSKLQLNENRFILQKKKRPSPMPLADQTSPQVALPS